MRHPVQRENFIRGGWVHREEPNFKRITRDLEVAGPQMMCLVVVIGPFPPNHSLD